MGFLGEDRMRYTTHTNLIYILYYILLGIGTVYPVHFASRGTYGGGAAIL